MKKPKLMLLLVPALLLVGCNTTSNNNNTSSNTSSSGGNSSSSEQDPVPEGFEPETNIPDSEKGASIAIADAVAMLQSLGIGQTVDEAVVKQYIETSPALQFVQSVKNDINKVKTRFDYSYGQKYSLSYFSAYSDPVLSEELYPADSSYPNILTGESWHYDYVRESTYFDLDHQVSHGWVDLTQSEQGVHWVDSDQYFYEEKTPAKYEEDKPGYDAMSSYSQIMFQSGSMINALLAIGDYSSALGIKMEVRSTGENSLYFYTDALDYMGTVMEAQIKEGRLEYIYQYSDLIKLAEMGGSTTEQIQEIIDSGITHQSSEMSYRQIAVSDLEYPNEAYYKEQAGK